MLNFKGRYGSVMDNTVHGCSNGQYGSVRTIRVGTSNSLKQAESQDLESRARVQKNQLENLGPSLFRTRNCGMHGPQTQSKASKERVLKNLKLSRILKLPRFTIYIICICMYIMYIYVYTYACIYIYNIYIYIYIYIYVPMHV